MLTFLRASQLARCHSAGRLIGSWRPTVSSAASLPTAGHRQAKASLMSGTRQALKEVKVHTQATGGGSGGSSAGAGEGGGGGGGGWGPFGLWATYLRLLESQPVSTKAWSAGLLNAVGDICSQKLVEHRQDVDWKRLSIFTLLGAVLVGPALHHWYLTLSRTVTTTGMKGTFIRLGLDQFMFAPIFIGGFMTVLLILQGEPENIKPKLQQDWPNIVINNWKLWIPFQYINFGFVPQHLQVLASNVMAVAWNTYLSHASHSHVQHA